LLVVIAAKAKFAPTVRDVAPEQLSFCALTNMVAIKIHRVINFS